MASETNPEQDSQTVYEIKVQGHLNPKWLAWFEGLSITLEEDGITRLTGPVPDQAALHGLLKKVRDLGLTLISINVQQSRQDEETND